MVPKSLTRATPARTQPTTCRHKSVRQMAEKCRRVRWNRGFSNSNTGASHTKKKLQEVYFEATKHWWAVQKVWKRIGNDPAHYCSMWATSIYRVCKKTWRSSKSYPPEMGRSSWFDWRQNSILKVHTSECTGELLQAVLESQHNYG